MKFDAVLVAGVSRLQRGFTHQRQSCENIVLLDGAALRFALMDDAFFPLLTFLDESMMPCSKNVCLVIDPSLVKLFVIFRIGRISNLFPTNSYSCRLD